MGQNSTKESRAQAELEKAATKGNLVDAQIAVKEGAQVNLQNKFGWSPLHHACTDGRLDVIKYDS
jgi:ankyrin repeat protein